MYLPFKKFAKDMKTASGSIFPITLMEKDLESLPMRTQDPGPTLKKGPVREDLPTRYLGAFLMGMLFMLFLYTGAEMGSRDCRLNCHTGKWIRESGWGAWTGDLP